MKIIDMKNSSSTLEEENLFEVIEKSSADLCEDITINNIPETLNEIELQIDRLKLRWGEFTYLIGQRIKIIRDNKLYRERGYLSFKIYVNVVLKMSESNAYYYISVYEFFTEEQTKEAGAKLKLLIPFLNKIKRDRELSDDIKFLKIRDTRDMLFAQIYNTTYREAEKIVKNELNNSVYQRKPREEVFGRFTIKDNTITIFEKDRDIQKELIKVIEDFYS